MLCTEGQVPRFPRQRFKKRVSAQKQMIGPSKRDIRLGSESFWFSDFQKKKKICFGFLIFETFCLCGKYGRLSLTEPLTHYGPYNVCGNTIPQFAITGLSYKHRSTVK